jgi:membrane associated rhomboid family serine protease
VDAKTGRSLLTTQEDSLDRAYIVAENTIRVISWLIWFGIYPIASEAFGTARPHVIRGVAILTVAVSLLFLVFDCTGSPQTDRLQNLMLWSGTTNTDTVLASEFAGAELTEEERAFIDEDLADYAAQAGEHHPYQLLTHALLHADLLHLAGNMLFLMVFGSRVNALIGNLWTALLYPVLAVAAGVAHVISTSDTLLHPMLGASGAVMGMAGMYLVFFPVHKVHMAFWWRWMILMPMSFKLFAARGFWVVLFYIAFDVLYTALGVQDNVAHWAHLGGFIAGVLIAVGCLMLRLVDARGGDLFSVVLGRRAWVIVGRPRRAALDA